MSTTDRNAYDVIVVGARCAGSPTAMLLARKGYRVLLVDRAHFPSDTVSTHLIHPAGVHALDQWGLLDRLVATGCPPIGRYSYDFGSFVISGMTPPAGAIEVAYAPRRTILDKLLVDAAGEAGAEVREGFTVNELVFDGDYVVGVRGRAGSRSAVTERARVVIGADGVRSRVADAVAASRYHDKSVLGIAYYSYWSGFAADHSCWAVRPRRGVGFTPTHDGLTMLLTAWPAAEFPTVKNDIEGNYLNALRSVFADRLDGARREERIVGSGRMMANHLHKPYGPGWALVGDAGYVKDGITAQGITDAFHDAEQCAAALDEVFTGRRPFDEAMADYQRRRDARVLPNYEFTTQLANLEEPPPPELLQLLASIAGNQRAMDEFAGVFAGALSPVHFFDPAHQGELVRRPA